MFQKTIHISTRGEGEIVNISPEISAAVVESGVESGLVNIFVTGSTAAVTTIEFEDGVLKDFVRSASVVAPDDARYDHDSRWGDGHGRSHVKSSFIGPSLTVPVADGKLLCGTWQQIVLVEFDVRARRDRTLVVTVNGS
jgi:secondary thiamine-phosphate synthase enzyme